MTRVFVLDGMVEVAADAPVLRADDLGVLRGESVFETLRVVDGRARFLDDHLDRLARSAARVEIALPSGWAELAELAAQGVEDASLRLVCTKGGTGFAVLTDVPAESVAARSGVRVVLLPLGISAAQRGAAPWLLGGVKSTSYAVNMASIRAAHEQGVDDAIWTSTDGYVLEAPTATVIAHLDGDWVTPPASVGILPGTTLLAVQSLTKVIARDLTVDELLAADEVALLSSVRGVAPVTAVGERQLGVGPITTALASTYEDLLRRS